MLEKVVSLYKVRKNVEVDSVLSKRKHLLAVLNVIIAAELNHALFKSLSDL